MEASPGQLAVAPPWLLSEFLSEDGLRAAQEYYFQTHAKNSRLIAEGRSAHGLAKSFVRRRLAREMGEDFKMYTGTAIGQATGQQMESAGIRGELNKLLEHIYRHIAPTRPIESPVQEDVTILRDPHGALEVVYAMVFYYGWLLRRYASLASNRRQVLKAILDEELFKWVWRMVIAFMMAPSEQKLSFDNPFLAAGLSYIPLEHQRAPLGQRLHEIGMFLLSKTLQDSHLRVPLCHYFVTYLRQWQSLAVLRVGRQELDEVYAVINRRMEGEPLEHPLVAIDALLNGKGNSMQSFDEVLADEQQVLQLIPESEIAFINQFEDFGNPERLASTIKRLVPDVRRESVEGQESSLMPLLLMLRTMPLAIREAVLGVLPVPILLMLRNRMAHAPVDDVGKQLGEDLRQTMEARRSGGQAGYTIDPRQSRDKAAPMTSVRVEPGQGAGTAAAGQGAAQEGAARRQPPPGAAAPDEPPPWRDPDAPQGEPAPPQPEAAAPPIGSDAVDEPAILAWKPEAGRIAAISLSAREVMELTGNEARFLVPWVVFVLRTGQVFGLSPEQATRERVERLVRSLHAHGGRAANGVIPRDRLAALLQQSKGASHTKVLLALARAGGLQRYLRHPASLAPALESLTAKLGDQFSAFMRKPNDESFRDVRAGLTGAEKHAIAILQRVARNQ